MRAEVDFGVCMNPEFLREGSAIKDYFDPSFIIIGQFDERKINFLRADISADYIVTIFCQSHCRDATNITQAKDTNPHQKTSFSLY